MSILVTGGAGFIGFHLITELLRLGHSVVSIDNLNDYYDPALKQMRLDHLSQLAVELRASYRFEKLDFAERDAVRALFAAEQFETVVHLGAQAGVRYSIENPEAYIDSNLTGFANILEGCRSSNTPHLIYASSSSVYGMNKKQPFSTTDKTDYPISLYAATKKSNELMAHAYSHLYELPMTGLRFFTVYGPYGRPDMAYYKFTKAILEGKPIDVYNHGDMLRDFTYIDDIVSAIVKLMDKPPVRGASEHSNAEAAHKVYNIGNNQPVSLRRFITAIESALGQKAVENSLPNQAGDVPVTFADIDELQADIGFKPDTTIEDGIQKFVEWYFSINAANKPLL